MKQRRTYENVTVHFSDGTALKIGLHRDGEKASLKLRIPESGWAIEQLFQASSDDSLKPAILVLRKG